MIPPTEPPAEPPPDAPTRSAPRRSLQGAHLRALGLWILLFAGFWLLFARTLAPRDVIVEASGSAEIHIPRSADGHYYLQGAVDGHPVTFMVDTGASLVSVSTEFAAAAGLPAGIDTIFRNADGESKGRLIEDLSVTAGSITIHNLTVGVGVDLGGRDRALLGQNFLRHVELIQRGDRLVLRALH